jgi:WhiB family redox-sensing transcriptional regulator
MDGDGYQPEENNSWMEDALCRGSDPAVFFPSDGVGVEQIRRVCADCVVRTACLEYALRHRIDHGVWGGTSERERRRILARRRAMALQAPQA